MHHDAHRRLDALRSLPEIRPSEVEAVRRFLYGSDSGSGSQDGPRRGPRTRVDAPVQYGIARARMRSKS